MIASLLIAALTLACLFLLVRLAMGPTPFDRLVATQGLLVCAALFVALFHTVDPRWIDAALAIVLVGAGVLAAGLKAVLKQGFRTPLGAGDGGAP